MRPMKFFFLLFNEKKNNNKQLSPVIATFSTYHLQDPTLFWKNEQTANKDLPFSTFTDGLSGSD